MYMKNIIEFTYTKIKAIGFDTMVFDITGSVFIHDKNGWFQIDTNWFTVKLEQPPVINGMVVKFSADGDSPYEYSVEMVS